MCDTRRAQHRGGPSANARTLHALLPSLLSYLLDCTATPRDQSRPSSLPTDSSLPTLSFALPARREGPFTQATGPVLLIRSLLPSLATVSCPSGPQRGCTATCCHGVLQCRHGGSRHVRVLGQRLAQSGRIARVLGHTPDAQHMADEVSEPACRRLRVVRGMMRPHVPV